MRKKFLAILIFDLILGLLILYKVLDDEEKNRKEKVGFGAHVGRTEAVTECWVKEERTDKEQEVKRIALTFDDGPHPYYTEQLLDGLKEREVVATFFVTGEHAALHPDVIRRMQEEGHLIGNHTYSHIQLRRDNKEAFKEELTLTNKILKEITGEDVVYVRPPYGSWDKALEKELNMIPVLWTVDPLDWCTNDVSCVVRNVTEKAGENDVVLLHDYFDSTITAALKIVDELLAEGYEFVTVEELLFG